MRFWLGIPEVPWLAEEPDVFLSRRKLVGRKTFPRALGEWALDSGGFTELNLYGEWRTSEREYAADVLLYEREIGNLAWVAPQDWMCEPFVLAKTGLDVETHLDRTVGNFLRLRDRLGELVVPVVQGWEPDDYLRCVERYALAGVALEEEKLVGVGSVCRRQDSTKAAAIFRALAPLRLHGFGIKLSGLLVYGDALASADSMAWSYRARRDAPIPGHSHRKCTNCLPYARRWRRRVGHLLGQQRLEVALS